MRISATFRALALAALVGASSIAVSARAQDAAQSALSAAAQAPVSAAGAGSAAAPAPFRAEPAPPRTLRAYWHVFIAFTLAWLLVFGYTLTLGRRFRVLEEQLERLEPRS